MKQLIKKVQDMHMLIYNIYHSSLCTIGSRFIHLISFFKLSNIPLYMCTTISVWILEG